MSVGRRSLAKAAREAMWHEEAAVKRKCTKPEETRTAEVMHKREYSSQLVIKTESRSFANEGILQRGAFGARTRQDIAGVCTPSLQRTTPWIHSLHIVLRDAPGRSRVAGRLTHSHGDIPASAHVSAVLRAMPPSHRDALNIIRRKAQSNADERNHDVRYFGTRGVRVAVGARG